jgi:hypothetical protein
MMTNERNDAGRVSAVALGAACLLTASLAQGETTVAGWDFSQYLGAGALSTDGLSLSTSLPANYSDFDPTFGAGAESAAFGTMYNDGTNGSTATTGAFQPYLPTSGVITLNFNAPVNGVPSGDVAFCGGIEYLAGCVIQNSEFPDRPAPAQDVSIISLEPHNLVFEADLSSLPSRPGGTEWSLSFAGKTQSSGTSDVIIDFHDGSSFNLNVATANLTASENVFAVPLGQSSADTVLVRLVFPASSAPGTEPIIDNLVITLPEPGTAGTVAALLTLSVLVRRQRNALRA